MGLDRRIKREQCVSSGLAAFCHLEGLGSPGPAPAAVIEAFVAHGLSHRSESTRGTYRSVLRQLTGVARPGRAPGYRGSVAAPPYSVSERAELFSMARAQPKRWRRHSGLAVLALGIGAGLRTEEIVAVTGDDVVCSGRTVTLQISGTRAREVPVRGTEARVIGTLAGEVGGGHLFHPEPANRRTANFVNDFCGHLVADPGAAMLTVGRCRSSYVCDHLTSGTPLAVLLGLTGICEVESLRRYAVHVEGAPSSNAELRHLALDQSR